MKKNYSSESKKTSWLKMALVFVFGIALGVLAFNSTLTLPELLVFLQITLIACVLALVLDVRKILLTGKE